MPSDESKGSQLDAIGSLAQRQLDNTYDVHGRSVVARYLQRWAEPAATTTLSRPVPKLGPFEIANKSAA